MSGASARLPLVRVMIRPAFAEEQLLELVVPIRSIEHVQPPGYSARSKPHCPRASAENKSQQSDNSHPESLAPAVFLDTS